jgi:hypothetical protein
MKGKNMRTTITKFAFAATLMGAAVFNAGCVAQTESSDPQQKEPVAVAKQGLSGEYYFSWGGTMNSNGTAYDDGYPYIVDMQVPVTGYMCMLTGANGDLLNTGSHIWGHPRGAAVVPSTYTWLLVAQAAPGHSASAAAVCFPYENGFTGFAGGFSNGETLYSGSQAACGLSSVAGILGGSALMQVSDQGSNPNVWPMGQTWTWTQNSNVNNAAPNCADTNYSSWWNWGIGGGTVTETMPAGTSCFLTSLQGSFDTDSYSNGAWASVDFNTGNWTFTAAPGVTAWWLCLN